jgi:hypothetical protein
MSLTPSVIEPVPDQTVLVDRAAFPKAICIFRCAINWELYSINIVRAVNFLNLQPVAKTRDFRFSWLVN